MRALEMRSKGAGHQKLTTSNWEQSLKLILLQLHEKLPKNSAFTIRWSFSIWSKLERWKSLISGCLMSWLKIKKKSSFWSVIFSYSTQTQTIFQLNSDVQWKVDFIWQMAMASSMVVLRRSSKALSKAKFAPKKKKKSGSLFGGLILVWSTIVFLIPVEPLHLRSMLSKSMRCIKNCNACSCHWSTEEAQFFSTTMPDCTSHNQHFKSWRNWATKFCLICHKHLTSLANQLPLIQAAWKFFARKQLSLPSGGRKCFPRVCWIPKHIFLCYRNKQTYFSLAKMCWL